LAKPQTGPARLDLLLGWLNGDLHEHHFRGRNPEPVAVRTDYAAIRQAVADFVESFDGSDGAGHLEVVDDPTPMKEPATEPTDEELDELEATLHILLEQGFDGPGDGVRVESALGQFTATPTNLTLPATSLRFAVRSARRQKPKKRGSVGIDGGLTALRNYRAPGAYVLQVYGSTIELAPFLVAHLLTQADMVAVKRCRRSGCTKFIVTATAARGAPKQFCSAACREWSRELEQQRRKQTRRGR
jgi:hypothetical protein